MVAASGRPLPEVSAMSRLLVSALWVPVAVLAACVKVDRNSGVEPLRRSQLVASGHIVAAEGGVVRPGGENAPFADVAVGFPPGALPADTDIEIYVRFGDPRLPSVVQTIEIRPAGLELLAPATVTVLYSELYASAVGSFWTESAVSLYSFVEGPEVDERVHEIADRDLERDLVRASTLRLGTFYCVHHPLRALIGQPTRLVDPGVALRAEVVDGRTERSDGGRIEVPVGKGSLASFWSSPAERNLLVLPGLLGDPIQLATATSVAPGTPDGGLNDSYDNVVVFQYSSGRSLAETANRLYDLVLERAEPGFGCSLIAHGTGGLVARYAIERSHLDPRRAGYAPDQPKLDDRIPCVVFVGTPNQGAAAAESRFASLLHVLFDTDLPFVQGIVDIVPAPDSFVAALNRGWERPASRYFAIAGDVGGAQSDGLVDVLSAVGVPRTFSRPDAHQVFSGPIYDHTSLLVFADRTGVVDQAREWLGKTTGNAPPVAGSIRTPNGLSTGIVEVPLSVSDAESAQCLLTVIFTVDGRDWRLATPADGRFPIPVRSTPAPGQPWTFRWDSAADGVGIGQADLVTMRFLVSDPWQAGTPGETGTFRVLN